MTKTHTNRFDEALSTILAQKSGLQGSRHRDPRHEPKHGYSKQVGKSELIKFTYNKTWFESLKLRNEDPWQFFFRICNARLISQLLLSTREF